MAAALDGDRVQAIFVVEPFLASGIGKGWTPIGAFADIDPHLCISSYFTSTQLIQTKGDLVTRFTEAMKESLAYADKNPDAVRQIVTTYTTIKSDVAAKMTLPTFEPEIDKASVEKLNQLAVTEGLLTAPADLSKLLP
jgi:NitT/TauT family transport system substrate-binding protein